jgi:hypothetical protein
MEERKAMSNNNHRNNGIAPVPITSMAGAQRSVPPTGVPHTGLMRGVIKMQPGMELDLGYRQLVKGQITEVCVRGLVEVLSDTRNYVVSIGEPKVEVVEGQRVMYRQMSVMLLHVEDAAIGEHVSAAGSPPELSRAGCFEFPAADGLRYFVLDDVAWRRVTEEEYNEITSSNGG